MKYFKKPNQYSPKKLLPSAVSETLVGKIPAFKAPHIQQESLRGLKPDIVVVKKEHLASNPMAFAQFLCIIEHNRE